MDYKPAFSSKVEIKKITVWIFFVSKL